MRCSFRYFYVKIYERSKRTSLFVRIILIFHSFAFMLQLLIYTIINLFRYFDVYFFFKLLNMLPISKLSNSC